MELSPGISTTSIEARTIQKLRIRIIPLIFVLYVVAFVDRINIGFASLTMNKELAITSQGKILLVEWVLKAPNENDLGKFTDLNMLVLLGGARKNRIRF